MLQPLMEGMEIHPSFALFGSYAPFTAAVVNGLALLSQSGLEGNFSSMGTCHVGETDMVHSFEVKGDFGLVQWYPSSWVGIYIWKRHVAWLRRLHRRRWTGS